MTGVVFLALWIVCFLPAFRLTFRAMQEDFVGDAVDVAMGISLAALVAALGGPLIVGGVLVARGLAGGDPKVFARKLAGESRADRRDRLRREIEELDRELGLS